MVPMEWFTEIRISPDIVNPVNNSTIKGTFPSHLKFAEVYSLYKKTLWKR